MDIIQVMTMKSEPQEGQEVKDDSEVLAFLEGEIIDLVEESCAVKEETQKIRRRSF